MIRSVVIGTALAAMISPAMAQYGSGRNGGPITGEIMTLYYTIYQSGKWCNAAGIEKSANGFVNPYNNYMSQFALDDWKKKITEIEKEAKRHNIDTDKAWKDATEAWPVILKSIENGMAGKSVDRQKMDIKRHCDYVYSQFSSVSQEWRSDGLNYLDPDAPNLAQRPSVEMKKDF